MDISQCIVSVDSELQHFGYQEDGVPFIGEVYFVSIQNQRGDRWHHNFTFPGVQVETDEDNYKFFIDIREGERARAHQLADAIERAGRINEVHWNPARPVYGSIAYQDYGMYDDIMLEKSEG